MSLLVLIVVQCIAQCSQLFSWGLSQVPLATGLDFELVLNDTVDTAISIEGPQSSGYRCKALAIGAVLGHVEHMQSAFGMKRPNQCGRWKSEGSIKYSSCISLPRKLRYLSGTLQLFA